MRNWYEITRSKRKTEIIIKKKKNRSRGRLDRVGDSAMIPIRQIFGHKTEKVAMCFHHNLKRLPLPSSGSGKRCKIKVLMYI